MTFIKRIELSALATFALCIVAIQALAQYSMQPSAGTFVPLVGGTAVPSIQNDQGVSTAIPIGFTFNYFGVNYTSVQATAEGFLSFVNINGPQIGILENSIDNSPYLNIIAPLWEDLDGESGLASYSTSGTAPNRVFTFQWLNWEWDWTASAGISFQVKLYESTNQIQFIYRPEAGALESPSASAGFVGNTTGQFYSLSDLSPSATLSQSPVNDISEKPVSGQTFTFSVLPPVTAPNTQASSIIISNNLGASVSIGWINGNGASRAVFMKQTAANETVAVTDNTTYNASANFGAADALVGNGWYCVYKGPINNVNVTGLQMGVNYRIQVLEYNGNVGGEKYLLTTATDNPKNVTTLLVAPQGAPSTPTLHRLSSTQLQIDLIEGSGSSRAIFIKQGTTGTAPVVDNTTYTANANFMAGSQIGNSGWYCVYNGPSTFVFTVTGLSGNTPYRVQAIDYNGASGSEKFHASPAPPVDVTTFESHPVPNYIFAASAGTFVPLVNGIAVNSIETDDAMSSQIPIGFTFRFGAVPFTHLAASSNGFLSFNPFFENNDEGLDNNLNSGIHRPVIAPLWDDVSGAGGQASYLTEGVAPNRIFTFEWLNWRWPFNGQANISFQVKLYEADNRILYTYRQEAGTFFGGSASIGVAFANTGNGNFLSFNNSSAAPTTSSLVETTSINVRPATGQVYTLTPQKLNQSISFSAITDKFFGSTPFQITVSATSGLPVTVQSSNENVATVSNGVVTIVGVGSVTLTASQQGNVSYNAAPDVQRAFIVNKGDQAISFANFNTTPFSLQNIQLTATTPSNLSIVYESSNPAVATVTGNQLTLTGIGTTNITASQGGNANYNAATPVVRVLEVVKGSQAISFGPIASKFADDLPFELTATSNSTLPITYESSNLQVATVSGSTVTIVGAGTTIITAFQTGNANFHAATPVVRTLVVNKKAQTVSWVLFPQFQSTINGHKKFLDMPFEIEATSSSGLDIIYSSSNPEVITVSGNTLTIVSAGNTTITALQQGNNIYSQASIAANLTVSKAEQVLTFEPITSKVLPVPGFNLNVAASSGLPVVLSSTSDGVTITGTTISCSQAGEVIVSALQQGNGNFYSKTANISFCVNAPKPTIISTLSPTAETLKLTLTSTIPNTSVSWYKAAELVSTSNELIVNANGGHGSYYAVVNAGPNCHSEPSDAFSVIITSITNSEGPSSLASVFPNPMDNFLNIKCADGLTCDAVMYNSLGAKIFSGSLSGLTQIDCRNYGAGKYRLILKEGNRLQSINLIRK